MEKSSVESKLRKIIREELDYYFDRLESRLNESKSSVVSRTTNSTIRDKPEVKLKESNIDIEKKNFRQKFSGLMGIITEGMEYPEEEQEGSKSILNSNVLSKLGTNPKTEGVYKALTKDYSELIKKMNKK
jgi:hypothetical protein